MNHLPVVTLALLLTGCGHSPAAAVSQPAPDPQWLGRYHWQLQRADDGSGTAIAELAVPDPSRPPQLDLGADGRLSVGNTCNGMSARYTVEGAQLRIGALASTRRACAPALMALDEALATRLHGALQAAVQMDGSTPLLVLTSEGGDRLEFRGQVSDAARYGDAGETVFLEVAAATVPCVHAPLADGRCLQVREVRYDARGLKAGEPGPWHAFADPIQGYEHVAGVRNVLRLKRYRIAEPAAGGADEAYVLDMVVESEDTGAR